MGPRMMLSGIVLETPDPRGLAAFYQRLLGYVVTQDVPGWVKILPPDHSHPGLSFQQSDDYVPPVWPAGAGHQQMQVHLDIEVDDLDVACAHAAQAGAVLAEKQFDDDVRVHLDPVGHPFCLFVNGGPGS